MTEMDEKTIISILNISKPVLMIDTATLSGKNIHGKYLAERYYPYWDCHFTNNPVMPGSYMLEMLGQSAALLEMTLIGTKKTPLLVSLSKVRFLREVKPSDILICDVTITNINGNFYTTVGKILLNEKPVCKAEMVHIAKM